MPPGHERPGDVIEGSILVSVRLDDVPREVLRRCIVFQVSVQDRELQSERVLDFDGVREFREQLVAEIERRAPVFGFFGLLELLDEFRIRVLGFGGFARPANLV